MYHTICMHGEKQTLLDDLTKKSGKTSISILMEMYSNEQLRNYVADENRGRNENNLTIERKT